MAEMFLTKVKVTPEMAKDLLEKNNKNRQLSRRKVEMMVNDIKAGKFELTHQPIAISEDGKLVDGQHRLTAVYESGIPTDMFVAYNAPRSTKIDIGKPRDVRTSLYMAGVIGKDSVEFCKFTYPLIRMIVLEQYGFISSRTLSADDLHNIFMHHKEDITEIVSITGRYSKMGVPVSSTAVTYPMLCAYKSGCPIETLKRWHEILRTGDYLDEEDVEASKAGKSVLLFVNYARGKKVDVGTPADRREEFIRKAMSSISHFEKKDVVSKIYGEYCYPMYEIKPEDFLPVESEAV